MAGLAGIAGIARSCEIADVCTPPLCLCPTPEPACPAVLRAYSRVALVALRDLRSINVSTELLKGTWESTAAVPHRYAPKPPDPLELQQQALLQPTAIRRSRNILHLSVHLANRCRCSMFQREALYSHRCFGDHAKSQRRCNYTSQEGVTGDPREEPGGRPGGPGEFKTARSVPRSSFTCPRSSEPSLGLFPG